MEEEVMTLEKLANYNGDKVVRYDEAKEGEVYVPVFAYNNYYGSTPDSHRYYNDYNIELGMRSKVEFGYEKSPDIIVKALADEYLEHNEVVAPKDIMKINLKALVEQSLDEGEEDDYASALELIDYLKDIKDCRYAKLVGNEMCASGVRVMGFDTRKGAVAEVM